MVEKGDFSWDQACSYSPCLYSEFIAFCQWINWRKVKAYWLQSHRFMFSVYTCSVFQRVSTAGIKLSPDPHRIIQLCTLAKIKPWESKWLHVYLCVRLWIHRLSVLIQTIWTLWYLCSLSLFLYVLRLCSPLSFIPLVSTSKYRPRICLGGTLLVVVVKKKTGYVL